MREIPIPAAPRERRTTRARPQGGRLRPAAVAVLLLLAVLLAAAGCGEKEEGGEAPAEPFTLALDWFPNPDHAGIYEAIERGHFEQAGLEVEPQIPSDPSAPIKQVGAGRVDLAISYAPEVVLARDQGLPVVAVAALVDEPLTSLVSLRGETPVREPRDLEGTRVATAGIPYQAEFLNAILGEAGLAPADVDRVDVGLNLLPSLLSGRVDAVLGMFWNVEGVDLERRDRDPIIFPVDELGIPTYDELVLVANSERVAEDPSAIRLFIAALERGTADALADPRGATRTLLAANEDLEPGLTAAQVRATLPALEPDDPERPYGYMAPREWEEFAGFLADRGLAERRFSASELLTNELLPGEIPD